jgi:hypothetical protein
MGIMLSILLESFLSWAVTFNPQNCSEYHFYEQKVQYYRQNPNARTCWLSIVPDNVNLYMRTYLLDPYGMFMVFNSYGPGPDSSHTGARIFYLFPRGRIPNVKVLNNQELIIETANPHIHFIMKSNSGKWALNQPYGRIIEASRIMRNNQGGIEFQGVPMLILDSGFQIGRDPRDSHKNSTFQDPTGQTCTVPNTEVFRYSTNGSIDIKFADDQALVMYLKKRCSNLSLDVFQ